MFWTKSAVWPTSRTHYHLESCWLHGGHRQSLSERPSAQCQATGPVVLVMQNCKSAYTRASLCSPSPGVCLPCGLLSAQPAAWNAGERPEWEWAKSENINLSKFIIMKSNLSWGDNSNHPLATLYRGEPPRHIWVAGKSLSNRCLPLWSTRWTGVMKFEWKNN